MTIFRPFLMTIAASCSIFSSSVFSAEERAKPFFSFSSFENLSIPEFLKKAMPRLSPSQLEQLKVIYEEIAAQESSPVDEDEVIDLNLWNEIESGTNVFYDYGFNYPPHPMIQGIFLSACSATPQKRVLDLGAGSGNDTIMALLTGNTLVTAADIHQRQLTELFQRVKQYCGEDVEKLDLLRGDFSNKKTWVPYGLGGGYDIVNANKVFQYLNHSQTKNMVGNIYTLLPMGGILTLTVATPAPDTIEAEVFREQKENKLKAPGIINLQLQQKLYSYGEGLKLKFQGTTGENEYYSIEDESRVKSDLTKTVGCLRQNEDGYYIVSMKGLHYHDLDTLSRYLNPYFDIIDSCIYDYQEKEYFLSVIARKK